MQLCIVHMISNSLKTVSWKDCKRLTPNSRPSARAVNEQDAMLNPERFRQDWLQYPRIADMWEKNRARIAAMFSHEGEIR